MPLQQPFLVDQQVAETPRTILKSLHLEMQRIFNKSILELKMLRGKEGSLGPDDGLEALHGVVVRVPTIASLQARSKGQKPQRPVRPRQTGDTAPLKFCRRAIVG